MHTCTKANNTSWYLTILVLLHSRLITLHGIGTAIIISRLIILQSIYTPTQSCCLEIRWHLHKQMNLHIKMSYYGVLDKNNTFPLHIVALQTMLNLLMCQRLKVMTHIMWICGIFDIAISCWICSNVISMVPFIYAAFFVVKNHTIKGL